MPFASVDLLRTVLCGVLCASLLAPPSLAQAGRVAADTTVVVVEIPVFVTKDGKPVRGLTIQDFEVYEGRRKQPLVGFEMVDLAALRPGTRESAVAQVPTPARRHFLIMLDMVFADFQSVSRSRAAALELVRHHLHPTDLVAIGLYGTAGPQILLGYTSDHRQAELAVQTFGFPQLIQRIPDPLNLVMGELRGDFAGDGGTPDPGLEAGEGRDGIEGMIQEAMREIQRSMDRGERHQQENRVIALTRSMSDLAKLMGSVTGRKYLVYFSRGFDATISGGTELSGEDQMAIMTGESWLVDTDKVYGSTRIQNNLETMLEEFRRADFVIQAIDAGGLQAGADVRARASGEASLVQLARDTGGESFRNMNDFGEAMGQLAERTSVTYLLAIQPENLRLDGRYRRLNVRLVGGPPGAQVQHRLGYYAPDAKSQAHVMERQLGAAAQVLGGAEGGSLVASALAAAFPMDGEKAYVPVLIEIDGPTLLAGVTGQSVTAELFVYALDASGGVADFFNKNLGLDLGRVGAAISQSGLKYWGHLELPPGSYTLRVLVRESESERAHLATSSLIVPGFGEQRTLLPPLIAEPPGSWLLLADEDRPEVDYPFMAGEQPFIPAAEPRVPGRGETAVQLVGYNLEGAWVAGRVVAADGHEVPGASFRVTEAFPGGPGPARVMGALATEGVTPGDYVLEVSVTDSDSGTVETSSIRIKVIA